jgi:nitrile hydratase beta subunit-like protein
MIERGHHDMGGLPAGKVEPTEHDYAEWERRVDAMSVLMAAKGITVDERRKHIEMIPPAAYDKMAYYERWIVALTQALIQRGMITTDELARKMIEVQGRD